MSNCMLCTYYIPNCTIYCNHTSYQQIQGSVNLTYILQTSENLIGSFCHTYIYVIITYLLFGTHTYLLNFILKYLGIL